MKMKLFYTNSYLIGEDAGAERSDVCYSLLEKLVNKLRSNPNKKEIRILDIGCGDMKFIVNFKKIKGVKIFGVEISPIVEEIAKKERLDFHKANVSEEKLPFCRTISLLEAV